MAKEQHFVPSRAAGGNKTKRPRPSDNTSELKKSEKSESAPRAAPSFLSNLQHDETDFPRGGGTTLTPLEYKQVLQEGRREADAEAHAESSSAAGKRARKQMSERQVKRLKKNEVDQIRAERAERDKDNIRVEELSYKRITEGTRLVVRIHSILPLHLVVSLPNSLLAHIPITEISSTLTSRLQAEENMSVDDDEDDEDSSVPDLAKLFSPGQYFPAKVIATFPTASQSFAAQYPASETTRLAARVEMSLMPDKVNSEVAKADLDQGYLVTGELISEEDNGWRIGLGVGERGNTVEGWLSQKEAAKLPGAPLLGQLITATIASSSAGGRVVQLTVDHDTLLKSQISEVSEVGSLLPGQLVTALITAVVPSGLNVKVCGFFDGTIERSHLDLGEEDIEEKYKVGKKVRARVIYENLQHTPRHFSLSALPHILAFSSPLSREKVPIEQAIEIGRMIPSVTVTRVIPEWGVISRTNDGLNCFTHISHLSDERLPALTKSTTQFGVGTVHRARVIGHSPLDGVVLLSFEQAVLDQIFMQVGELKVGQVLKGTVRRLLEGSMFINIHGSVDGIVFPTHYADISLKHPEKRFKADSSVRCRVFAIEPARNRVVLTLKKTLVDSELETPGSFSEYRVGQIVPAVVIKILEKGCIVELFGGVRALVPQAEASQTFVSNIADLFFVGKPVNVRIMQVQPEAERLVASIRQAAPAAIAAAKLDVGDAVHGLVTEIHTEQAVITLQPSNLKALLSMSNLSNHRSMGIDELRASLKVGEQLEDLVVVSKNPTSGLLIVANRKSAGAKGQATVPKSASLKASDVQPGQILKGKVSSHTPKGTIISLDGNVRGRVHPCDASDDFAQIATGEGPLNVGEDVDCFVLDVDKSARIVQLSTRASRVTPLSAGDIVDPEIQDIKELKAGSIIRGLVSNITPHGLFVALGRSVTARVMIKELFDEVSPQTDQTVEEIDEQYVKDWESQFHRNQLVSGKIVSVNESRNQVEMTLRKNPDAKGAKRVAKLDLADFEKGQKVVAVVKRVEVYGMFLRIEDSNVSGLCHKSEISDQKKQDVSAALRGFREGDKVKAKIVSIDRDSGKINFGIKASYFDQEDFEGEAAEDEEVESSAEDDEEEGDDDDEAEDAAEIGLEGSDGDEEEETEEEDEEDGEDNDDDDEASDIDVELSAPTKQTNPVTNARAKKAEPAPIALSVPGGFDWSGRAASPAAESGSGSESEEETAQTSKPKSKRRAAEDLAASAPGDSPPSSTAEYERALFASPNSSFLWIQYMSFLLQLHEVEKARRLGRQALEKIAYREEGEKLNVWMALVNLELGFGTEDTAEKVFKEAVQYNDARSVYTRYAEALAAAGKGDATEEVHKKIVKKFSAYPDSWTKFAEFYLAKGEVDAARALLPRAMKSLDKSKHVETIERMAILEFKHGEPERGKTLFEGLVDRYPKRLDLWSVYIDQLAKLGDAQGCRALFERALQQKLTSKKAKFLFKKWLGVETRIGDAKGQEAAKEAARDWVARNVKPESGDENDEDEEDEE